MGVVIKEKKGGGGKEEKRLRSNLGERERKQSPSMSILKEVDMTGNKKRFFQSGATEGRGGE